MSYDRLIAYLKESDHLLAAARLLQWDQETGMPAGGQEARAEVLSTLAGLSHQRGTSPHLRELLEFAQSEASTPDRIRQLELVRRDLDRAAKVPANLVERLAKATSTAQQVWSKARKERDFRMFQPYLEEVVGLKREEGALLAPSGGSAYDGLLSDYEPLMRTADWSSLFEELERELPTLAREIHERQGRVRERLAGLEGLRGPFPREGQLQLCRELAQSVGYDFSRGRLDLSAHPFSETIHSGDSRITTRIDESDLVSSVFATLHETGHALYEQGLPEDLSGTPLGGFCSMSVHESQSRLWENLVGRSDAFWQERWSLAQERLPALARVRMEDWTARARLVRPSLIRTESDEVTYNLHVLVRFRLERALVDGDLAVSELPSAWNEAYGNMLGIVPSHDGEGVLQDVHWSAGMFGYFPTYTLGNLLSAQFFRAAADQGVTGSLPALLTWLREKVHAPGHLLETADLARRATGRNPSASDFLAHLRERYLG
ncbi:MAG TPA: carboxypeptidase M32 [Fibrobacteria bacterium]|nr:carboxypeptidase M32 [Fibrobacteria bacterium]